jgi:putative MATE family efflux protein
LGWPLFVEMALLVFMGNVDVFMISRFSEDAMGAVGVSNQLIQFSIIMFGFVSAGATVIISQYIGAEKHTDAKNVAGIAIICSFIFGLVISLVYTFAGPYLLLIMDLEEHMMNDALRFLRIVGGFIFLQAVLTCINAVLRSYGNTRDTLVVTIVMNIISISGNVLFLFGFFGLPVLGVFGVAASTSFSRMIAIFLAMFFLFRTIGNPFKYLKINQFWGYAKKILKIGIPSAGENMSYSGYQIFLTAIVTTMGPVALSARIYSRAINMFMVLVVSTIGQAGQIILGQLMGQKEFDEMYRRAFRHLKISLIASVACAFMFFIFSPWLMRIFTDNEEIISLSRIIFGVFIFQEFGRSFNVILITSLRAAGDVQFPVYVGVGVMWGVGALMGFVLGVVFDMGLVGVIIGTSLDECVRGIIMLFRWKSRKWQTKGLT